MKKGEAHIASARNEEMEMGRKQVFMCTHQNCTCWFRRKGDLIKHQKREHEK
jgi:hypothetical protein